MVLIYVITDLFHWILVVQNLSICYQGLVFPVPMTFRLTTKISGRIALCNYLILAELEWDRDFTLQITNNNLCFVIIILLLVDLLNITLKICSKNIFIKIIKKILLIFNYEWSQVNEVSSRSYFILSIIVLIIYYKYYRAHLYHKYHRSSLRSSFDHLDDKDPQLENIVRGKCECVRANETWQHYCDFVNLRLTFHTQISPYLFYSGLLFEQSRRYA